MSYDTFHPVVVAAFERLFRQPTPVQLQSWEAIASGQHTLIAAPTGSGKTLAAFLAAIDALVKESRDAPLPDETRVLYISPLKALSNDVEKNLQIPLQAINDELERRGESLAPVRAAVRTGDTPTNDRVRMRKRPPHIVVTTPESLYILLTSESGRDMLRTVRAVIVDEIHALAGNKRGAHLSLSLERLQALVDKPLLRIGISATQKPIEDMAHFLVGQRSEAFTIVDTGHSRKRDLDIELTGSPLDAVMSNEVWGEIYNRLAEFTQHHHTTLIFANTRRTAERVARHLADRIGDEHVTSHHGSLSREHRLLAEQRLKAGQLKALVATASLELGIDIGDVDLVVQLGSPRSISGFVQRVGRSGHAVNATPKGRIFPLTRDDLVECIAILQAVDAGELDRIDIPVAPLDVLSQQIIAEIASREWHDGELYDQYRNAWPYRHLDDTQWHDVLTMVSEGFSTRRGRRGAYLHWDQVNHLLRPRRNARLTAITNGGAIPDLFDYDVVMEPQGLFVGTLNEDFSFESLPGDIFQLGNTSYRILKVVPGCVYVEDAQGLPPTIPFWFGEAPGRSDELSRAVSDLRHEMNEQLGFGETHALTWLAKRTGLGEAQVEQLNLYLATAYATLGVLPDQENIVFERFFDQSGDMHFVVHSVYGSRINRAWGLALRKRFCRRFNFELQAAALDDAIVLSLGATHSFPLEEVAEYLHPDTVRPILIQALLDAPMFGTHWRWNAATSLALVRNRNGKRVPPQWQRNDAEDLVALVFPDQLACFENIQGEREVPKHPLVDQTLDDCLNDLMDIAGLEHLLTRLKQGNIKLHCRDLTSPSVLAAEIINARPYAFLDDAPAEERRTLAIQRRGFASPADAANLSRLDPAAIARVREEAWPDMRNADELHDALVVFGFLDVNELPTHTDLMQQLIHDARACYYGPPGQARIAVARERLHEVQQALPAWCATPKMEPLKQAIIELETAQRELLRNRLELSGPTTAPALGSPLDLDEANSLQALLALEQEGYVLRGQFSGEHDEEWCERRLLARIHRYTLGKLRKEIAAVPPATYMQFLFHWHGLDDKAEGVDALLGVVQQLEGCTIAASAWEADILPSRLRGYQAYHLDQLCSSGQLVWLHPNLDHSHKAAPLATSGISLLQRSTQSFWVQHEQCDSAREQLGGPAKKVLSQLEAGGAEFFFDLVQKCGLLRTEIENALSELVASGWVTADSFTGLRALLTPSNKRPTFSGRRVRGGAIWSVDNAGRWSAVSRQQEVVDKTERLEHVAWTLLHRYGVVFRKVLEQETHIPPWRDLLRFYYRLEARGEIRGGRFVDSFSGEQFALPEAVGALRKQRKTDESCKYQIINATDPLNLTGIITPGQRVATRRTSRILYRDGVPLAVLNQGKLELLQAGETNEHELMQLMRA